MFFKDLSYYEYHLSSPVKQILNVGWLDKDHGFETGELGSEFHSKLSSIIVGNSRFDASFNRIRGIHPCSLCGERDITVSNTERQKTLGMSEILVPDINGNSYFASPSMIYHYVVTHRYLPPKSFIEAVMNVDLSMKFLAEDIFDNLLGART